MDLDASLELDGVSFVPTPHWNLPTFCFDLRNRNTNLNMDAFSIWARSCENVSFAICEQQRRRSACASAQSDQHLCCPLRR